MISWNILFYSRQATGEEAGHFGRAADNHGSLLRGSQWEVVTLLMNHTPPYSTAPHREPGGVGKSSRD